MLGADFLVLATGFASGGENLAAVKVLDAKTGVAREFSLIDLEPYFREVVHNAVLPIGKQWPAFSWGGLGAERLKLAGEHSEGGKQEAALAVLRESYRYFYMRPKEAVRAVRLLKDMQTSRDELHRVCDAVMGDDGCFWDPVTAGYFMDLLEREVADKELTTYFCRLYRDRSAKAMARMTELSKPESGISARELDQCTRSAQLALERADAKLKALGGE